MPNFRGNEDLCKLTKEYSNALLCKFFFYSLQHCETFDVSHVFLPLTITELSTLKQVRVFLAHFVCRAAVGASLTLTMSIQALNWH